jgi:protein-disulfide isomerase
MYNMKEKIKVLGGILVFGLLVFWVSMLIVQSIFVQQPTKSKILGSNVANSNNSANVPLGKVTVVEFGDFQCPACAVAEPTVERIRSEYGEKISFTFLHFPIPFHENAEIASEAAEAAQAQGKFWEMYKLLYTQQDNWSDSKTPIDIFLVYASQLGLDVNKFKSDITSGVYKAIVQKDLEQGKELGVNATPTFFINDKKVVGAISYDKFKAEIEAALQAAK